MNPTATTRTRSVAPLDVFGAADLETVGGKAANLGELIRAGLPVPRGFVVTTRAYTTVTEGAGASMSLIGPGEEGDGPAPADLRSALARAEIPEHLREAISVAYRGLGEDVPVAVRSSATAEDLPGSAFAGQQDTYLNVVGTEAVLESVRRCWASLWTDRAVAYRRERAIDQDRMRIAVVVQEMVDSEVAGVMFTADPVSGNRDRIVVDAGAGLGEAVVSGLVTPDHYLLDRVGELLEWTPGRGERVIRSVAGGGVHHEEIGTATEATDPVSDQALLTREQLRILAAHARTITEHFGSPQDIEWALSDGRFRIVQARPMTALPPPSVPLNRRQRLQAAILTEYLPVRPYPMDVSTFLGRGPAEMMREIAEYYGMEGTFQDYLREEDGVVVQLVPPNPHPSPRALSTPVRLARKAREFRPVDWAEDPRQKAFLSEADALDALDLSALPWVQLVEVPERALRLMAPCRDLRIDYLPGAGLALLRAALATGFLGRRNLLADLLGGARTRTEDSNRALRALADRVHAAPELRRLFTEREPAGILVALTEETGAGSEGPGISASEISEFRTELDSFLREYGRRETTSPLLVSPPTLAESPEVVLGLVRSLIDRAEEPGTMAADTAEPEDSASRSARALDRLLEHPLLRGHRARARVGRWLRTAQEGVAFREDTHFYFTAMLPALRRSLLEIGERLRRAGVVEEAFDVFHLRLAEVLEVEDVEALPSHQAERLRALVRARAAKRAEMSGVPMIDPARVFPHQKPVDALVIGSPAGAGTVTGPVRVIRGAADFDRLRDGDVLVCPYTNPTWTPLFRRAAAVVVDSGAVGSHAAIVAREYGIPAVMGTGTGTSVLTDGRSVTVDGARGLVTAAS
ncbi:PEP/pyruvate-binding domain-containing protein [Nocardiopsis sp. JB363]|uniref:PEP/pyruvate-binding domain-containing protein n=1 Tax=Nocardiopsis sp. JB363 TaxID=1434837 RepID=UPI000979F672|nr:PEP/pyruvate-binding domain-containing protein [Nocardiopsis sp. JB363]SIO85498.1 Phosphoenolpyruvate synthase [Nocardiopsis sp. JB363]